MDIFSLGFSVSNLGAKSYQKLLAGLGNPKKAWEGSSAEYEDLGIKGVALAKFENFRNTFDSNQYIKLLEKEKVQFVSFSDKKYPEALKMLPDPPIGIYCMGNLTFLSENFSIGVVGTRKITDYGKSTTEFLVEGLVKNNACIISGLALGVDASAHRQALESGGATIAVLACGVNCCNPSENYALYREILKKNGLIVSEYPLSVRPNKGTFLMRNRIIASLSNGVLVTEAAEKSGSLVTAEWGFRLSKKVFAVPGLINSSMSKGSLSLLKKGAILVTEAEDILKEYNDMPKISSISEKIRLKLSENERVIFDLIQNEGIAIDDLTRKTKMSVRGVSVILSNLEIRGLVRSASGKWQAVAR